MSRPGTGQKCQDPVQEGGEMFGFVLIISSILITFLGGLDVNGFMNMLEYHLFVYNTFKLLASVLLIILIGMSMKKAGHLKGMLDAFHRLLKDNRFGIIIPPALIGLLPMPGGAMFSAPMVEESSKDVNLSPAQKTYINYWFRHIWEYGWPLYPGLIISASILNVNVSQIVRSQALFIFVPIFIGSIYVFNRVPKIVYPREKRKRHYILDVLKGIWPIFYILIFSIIVSLPVVFVLFTLSLIMIIVYKQVDVVVDFFKHFPWKMVVLIIGIMMFKGSIQDSGILNFMNTFYDSNMGKYLMLILLPFLAGIVTGVNQAYVAIAFPVLLPLLLTDNGVHYANFALAYISGFEGVLLSPVHLCLSLSKSYYGATFKDVYKLLLPSVVILAIFSLIFYWIKLI